MNETLKHTADLAQQGLKRWHTPELRVTWQTPVVRDQSIASSTHSKPNSWSSEASPGTGS